MVYKFIIILLLIDLFVGLVLFFRFHKKTITLTWSLQALLFYALVVVMWLHFISSEVENYVTMGSIMAFVAVCYFVKVLFGSLGGIILLSELALKRRAWSWITVYLLTLGGFFVSLYGVTIGRYDYKITHRNVVINDLPKSFKGFKIVQISDLHLGSFAKDYKGVDKLIEDINSENADVVLFSGDMVNSYADEMEPWIEKLRGIKSRYGNFAVTGNHDHGDHAHFSTAAARVDNLNRFFENMERASFKMLNNDSHALTIGGDTIFLCGVMNYGRPPFSRWGKLDVALKGTEGKTKILLSHNPTHWREQVVGSDIDLTLAGHTHAMQMGIDLFGFKWSPSQYMYKEYDGLYRDGANQLNVSRGVGYIGLAGRIGMRPEIIVINLN